MRLEQPQTEALLLSVRATGLNPPDRAHQEVEVYANDLKIAHWSLGRESSEHQALVPRAPDSGVLRISFRILYPVSPHEAGIAPDFRPIGLGLQELSLRPATSPAPR